MDCRHDTTALHRSLLHNQGSRQQLRLSDCLQPGYIELEERPLAELLRQAFDYASCIDFVAVDKVSESNDDNKSTRRDDWSDLLINNETVLLALIATDSSAQRELSINRLLSGRHDQDYQLLLELVTLCVNLAVKMDQWFVKMQRIQSSVLTLASRKLYDIIQACKADLSDAHSVFQQMDRRRPKSHQEYVARHLKHCENSFLSLSPIWSLSPVKQGSDGAGLNSTQDYRRRLESTFFNLSNNLTNFSIFCRGQIDPSLYGKFQEPSSALIVAFIRLLNTVNKKTNGFTQKHQNFYYRDTLKINNHEGRRDKTTLILQPSDPRSFTLEAQTSFATSNPNLSCQARYELVQKSSIIPARVAAVANCFLHHDRYNVPAVHLGLVNNIHARITDSYAYLQKDWAHRDDRFSSPLGRDNSLFGAYLPHGQYNNSVRTEVGFIVASKTLLLEQGRRTITLAFDLEDTPCAATQTEMSPNEFNCIASFRAAALSAFKKLLFTGERMPLSALISLKQELCQTLIDQSLDAAGFSAAAQSSIDEIEAVYAKNTQQLKDTIFSTGFELSISASTGWYRIDSYQCRFEETAGELTLVFTIELDDSAPPVVVCNSESHNDTQVDASFLSVELETPALKVVLAQNCEFYLYSLLQHVVLERLTIDVDVKGLKNLIVHNDLGPVDTSLPFQPLGSHPRIGTSFVVGSPEFSFKKLSSLSLDIDWYQLPTMVGGFNQYYQGYGLEIDNNDFQFNTSILRNSHWFSENSSVSYPLFTLGSDNKLSSKSHVDIACTNYFQQADADASSELYYHANSSAGFIRITLSGKPMAFGHDAYPHILSQKLVQSIKSKTMVRQINEPFTPAISRIGANYQATTLMNVEQLSQVKSRKRSHQIYTINPFGVQSITQQARAASAFLMPQFNNSNSVYIGLELLGEYSGEAFSLYFDMHESSISKIRHTTPRLEWSWLSLSNQWCPIAAPDILVDTTAGFLRSGVITVRISDRNFHSEMATTPRQASTPNLLDGSKLWIRVSSSDNPEEFCRLNGVEVNALEVHGSDTNGQYLGRIPPQSIDSSGQSIVGVKSVFQPKGSIGGKPKEADIFWQQRTSERLRHRKRPVTPWDFERVTLEQFSVVDQAKCFPAVRIDNGQPVSAPGHLLVVVIPPYEKMPADLTHPPKLASAIELDSVRQYLSSLCASGVNINVCNPNYEYLQVRCSVMFNDTHTHQNPHHVLNQDLIEYLSSWGKHGPMKQFEWEFYKDEIEAFIRERVYIEYTTKLSLIKVTRLSKDQYHRTDSALDNQYLNAKQPLTPKYVTSVVIPASHHAIEVIAYKKGQEAIATGYSDLEIGTNFILS